MTATVEVVEPRPAEPAEAAAAGPLLFWKPPLLSKRRPEVTATVEVVEPPPLAAEAAAAAGVMIAGAFIARAGDTRRIAARQHVENFIVALDLKEGGPEKTQSEGKKEMKM